MRGKTTFLLETDEYYFLLTLDDDVAEFDQENIKVCHRSFPCVKWKIHYLSIYMKTMYTEVK